MAAQVGPGDQQGSVFDSALPVEAKLERARTELLDLSARNRLLNMPRSAKSVRSLDIVDEQTAEIFRLLVRDGKAFTFLAGRSAEGTDDDDNDEAAEGIAELSQPEDEGRNERGVLNRHADTKLQTRLTPAGLQKRLLDLYTDARTLEEEQGVNILYLALGTLKWIDPTSVSKVRYAPLILVPVSLERGNAAEKFKLKWRQEDPAPNLSLEAYLDRVHGLKMPLYEFGDAFDTSSYIAAVADSVAAKPDWIVAADDINVGFFSFAKFLMYRDLDPDVWPAGGKLNVHPLIRSLVSDGFENDAGMLAEDANIDPHISPAEMVHIVDCDSSQTMAVHEVRRGRDIVIQGPPGTGKSQTIANIIASAVADGRTVLFVAEKMAALDVVKRRLDATGVGAACLELHSNKASKRAVLEELRRTWELGAPKGEPIAALNARLTAVRDDLNAHAVRLHEPAGAAGLTPFAVIGQLTRLRQDGQSPTNIELDDPLDWTTDDLRVRLDLLAELVVRVADIGTPKLHVWNGIRLDAIIPTDVVRLMAKIAAVATQLTSYQHEQTAVAAILEMAAPDNFEGLDRCVLLANRVATAPDLTAAALGASAWDDQSDAITRLLADGAEHRRIAVSIENIFNIDAWTLDVASIRIALAGLPDTFSSVDFASLGQLATLLPALKAEADNLASVLQLDPVKSLADASRVTAIGECVASAPDASPEAFAASLWDTGVGRATDLAAAVAAHETARAVVGTRLSDAAWPLDLVGTRTVLAAHGTGWLRFFSSEWRRANRLIKSVLADPREPLSDVLPLLDALARGQSALTAIRSDDEFGRSAFAADWRGECSVSPPLVALAAWMASLRGIGTEPRVIASRLPDRTAIGARSHRVRSLLAETRPLLAQVQSHGEGAEALFGSLATDQSVELESVIATASRACNAYHRCADTMAISPDKLGALTLLLDELATGQTARSAIGDGDGLGTSAFGEAWRGVDSNWPSLQAAADWIGANGDIRLLASRITDRALIAGRCDQLAAMGGETIRSLHQLMSELRCDTKTAFGSDDFGTLPIVDVAGRTARWLEAEESLSKWIAYHGRAKRGRELGLGEIVARLHDDRLAPAAARPVFEMAYYEAIFSAQAQLRPELARFDGTLHSRSVNEFISLDRQRITASSLEVVRAHHQRIPSPTGGAAGPLGVLRGEIARKRGHMPIRQLMLKAAPAVQALKPVMMMSPLSVAQFLPPGVLSFDLLVMDEASQIQPVDALGAIARCKQVVVVGDPKQLPPTAFFAKVTGGDANADDDGAGVADIESILGLFTARGLPTRMLRWHYRSRHQSLIAVSNKQFYENKLFIVPSPYTAEAGMGLAFRHVENGIFETGTTRTNPIEAKRVAAAIIDHAINHPELSLGVAAFSAAQRRVIQDQLELLRRLLPIAQEAFFQAHPSEPFFIKNLENVQGDERDVIFISVGYGPSAPGLKPAMRFGPLGSEGGERRLNVLISRAKRRCEVFSSLTDEDIDPEFARTRKGVFAFKLFLHFARTGQLAMAESSGRDHDSVFEEQVARALRTRGYNVARQVGIAGFFIDLAISDPEYPGRYLLGIECDGAAYHSSRSARDRDRLRQAVLEDHGWVIHRIWSGDWFQRPREQLDVVVAAIDSAKADIAARKLQAPRPARAIPFDIAMVERADVTEIGFVDAAPTGANDVYDEATITRPAHIACDLHEAPTGLLTALSEQVVAIEGPVHADKVVNRLRDAWGLKRAGVRIQEAIDRAIAVAVRQGRLHDERGFLSVPGTVPKVRDRSGVASASLRRPEMLPPSELRAAMVNVVEANFGASRDQVIQIVSRAIGSKGTSAQLRAVIEDEIDAAIKMNVLVPDVNLLVLGTAAVRTQPGRKSVESPVEKLIAQGEHQELEFKETLRWDIALLQPSKKLEDVAIKTIAGFANSSGGVLLLGVRDDSSVAGLDPDLAILGSRDKFELHLTNLFNKHFGQAFAASKVRVSFPVVGLVAVCRIDVQRSDTPIFVTTGDRNGVSAERFFVRSGNSSQDLSPRETTTYLRGRAG